uniref:Uncharacterized protein n=1 Tax=Cacopsylla melanoneura TaxID=428564 RepID=A0A8D9AD79_9HEMI
MEIIELPDDDIITAMDIDIPSEGVEFFVDDVGKQPEVDSDEIYSIENVVRFGTDRKAHKTKNLIRKRVVDGKEETTIVELPNDVPDQPDDIDDRSSTVEITELVDDIPDELVYPDMSRPEEVTEKEEACLLFGFLKKSKMVPTQRSMSIDSDSNLDTSEKSTKFIKKKVTKKRVPKKLKESTDIEIENISDDKDSAELGDNDLSDTITPHTQELTTESNKQGDKDKPIIDTETSDDIASTSDATQSGASTKTEVFPEVPTESVDHLNEAGETKKPEVLTSTKIDDEPKKSPKDKKSKKIKDAPKSSESVPKSEEITPEHDMMPKEIEKEAKQERKLSTVETPKEDIIPHDEPITEMKIDESKLEEKAIKPKEKKKSLKKKVPKAEKRPEKELPDTSLNIEEKDIPEQIEIPLDDVDTPKKKSIKKKYPTESDDQSVGKQDELKEKLKPMKIEKKSIEATKLKVEDVKEEKPQFAAIKLRKASLVPKKELETAQVPKRRPLKSRITRVTDYPTPVQYGKIEVLPPVFKDCGELSRNYEEGLKVVKKQLPNLHFTNSHFCGVFTLNWLKFFTNALRKFQRI